MSFLAGWFAVDGRGEDQVDFVVGVSASVQPCSTPARRQPGARSAAHRDTAEAIRSGASILVIGRAVTTAGNPGDAAQAIASEVAQSLSIWLAPRQRFLLKCRRSAAAADGSTCTLWVLCPSGPRFATCFSTRSALV
ncbi:hypothetical protein [Nocardia wallacei]|uniref:hypothetical protein n=1 Tax=Nocardia wallacei TaxID=480035 RepID=UPI002454430E|nr:hypothetical protein [Nocardia wallacei]